MDYLPIFVDLRGRVCLVVGGGAVAARKTRTLRGAGTLVRVIAPRLGPAFADLLGRPEVSHRAREFAVADVDGCALVVAATDDAEVNRRVADAARARGLPVNVVDTPSLCTFLMPSIVDRTPVVAAVSTAGAAPVLARLLRSTIESLLPPSTAVLAALTGEYRERVKVRFADRVGRRRFWERMLHGEMAELVHRGDEAAARAVLERSLEAAGEEEHGAGVVRVIVIPPAPDLLTLRALRHLQEAEVVVHGDGADPRVTALARRDASFVILPATAEAAAAARTLAEHARPGVRVVWICEAVEREVVERLDRIGIAVTLGPSAGPDDG